MLIDRIVPHYSTIDKAKSFRYLSNRSRVFLYMLEVSEKLEGNFRQPVVLEKLSNEYTRPLQLWHHKTAVEALLRFAGLPVLRGDMVM